MNNLFYHIKKSVIDPYETMLSTTTTHYSFNDIDMFSANIANRLSIFGMQPGDRLAAQVEKSEYAIFLYLACLRSGLIYLPLNNSYTRDELEYFFKDASPKLIVCDPSNFTMINHISSAQHAVIKTLDETGKGSLIDGMTVSDDSSQQIYSSQPDDCALILYTSGTTGKPKGAMLTHRGLYSNALDLNNIWMITQDDTVLHVLPLFHVHGLFISLHTALIANSKIILLPRFDVDTFFRYLPDATVFMGVPTYYIRALSDQRLNPESCKHVRLFISGSAPLLASTFNAFEMKTGMTILERYGMTETGINTSNPLVSKRKVGTVGLPLPNVLVRVVNDDTPVSAGIVGNIQVKGPNLFSGYWMKPEKTEEEFTLDGYFKTGDLGSFDTDGYLTIVGRSKDMIITGGLNVYPKEIESTIDSIHGVAESAVIGIPHDDFGEAVVAVIARNNFELDEPTVLDIVRRKHAGYKCPKQIVFVNTLPKNTMGKVQKNVLRKQFQKMVIEKDN